MKPRTILARGLALALLLGSAAAAHAQTPTLSILAPSTKEVDLDNMTVSLSYNLPGGRYAPADIVFVVPTGAIYVGSSFSTGTFTHSESPAGTHHWKTADPFVVDNLGTAGAINIDIDLPTWTTLAGTVFTWDADIVGDFTPTGGSEAPLAVDAADVHTTALAEPVDPAWFMWNSGVWTTKWITHPVLGPGLQVTYDLRPTVERWQPLAEGWTYRYDLGSKLYFVRAYSDFGNNGFPPGDNSLVVDQAPPDFDTAGGGTVLAHRPLGATAGANDLTRGSNEAYPYGHAPHLYVEVYIPCAQIPIGAAIGTDDYRVDMSSSGQRRVAGGLGPVLTTQTLDIATSNQATGSACFSGGALTKSGNATVGEDRLDTFTIRVDPPKAAQPIEGVIVDILPVGFSDVTLTVPPEFIGYYCVLPPGVTAVSLAEFKSTWRDTQCSTTKPATPTSVTHLMFYAAAWGGSGSIGSISANVNLYLPAGFVPAGEASRTLANTAYFHGLAQLDGDPELEPLGDALLATHATSNPADPFQDDAVHTVVAGSHPGGDDQTDYNTSPHVVAPGQYRLVAFRQFINANFSPARNPRVIISLPDGLVVEHPQGLDPITTIITSNAGGCGPAPSPAHIHLPAPGDRPLVFGYGDPAEPYDQRSYCMRQAVWLRIDETRPWVDGTDLEVVMSVDADNELATAPHYPDVRATFQVDVPPEITVEPKPACQQTAVGGSYPPAFVVSTENSSGASITNLTTTFVLPRSGVDGSSADAIFAGVEALGVLPAGAVFEVSRDGGQSWDAYVGADPSVSHVRLRGLAFEPYGAAVKFLVKLESGGAVSLVGRATATSTEVPLADSGPSEAFIGGSCHALTVTKFFDAEGDGAFGAGDTRLGGWGFEVANGGVVIASGATDATGSWSVVLPAASYQVSELIPVAAADLPQWQATTPEGAPSVSQSVTIADSDMALSFGNTCSCAGDADRCTWAPCRLDASGGTATVDDAFCDTDELPVCVAQSACGVADCDPATGACSYDGPTCQAIDFYIPVRDGGGALVGNAHCILEAGQPPVCDMENGVLKITPVAGASGQMCGLAPPQD